MEIRFAQSPRSRVALGLGFAALAQWLSLFLAGAGDGWVTPLFVSVILWVVLPVTLYVVRQPDRRGTLILWVIGVIALGADALLIGGTLGERSNLGLYVQVNGVSGLATIGLWLGLWLFWQAIVLRALINRCQPSSAPNA